MKHNIIKISLSLVIIVLGYLLINSIMAPVKFKNEKIRREKVVIKRLIEIRNVQLAFKGVHSAYAATFDTLIEFINNGKIPVVNIIPDPNDTTFTKTISDTIAYVNVVDSLFKERQNFNPQSLRYIPFSDGQEFDMDAGVIEISKIKVNVFEVKALYKHILNKMDKQLLRNLLKRQKEYEKFEGRKVGSMKEASTDGNWEF
jgi:hypothetical protein